MLIKRATFKISKISSSVPENFITQSSIAIQEKPVVEEKNPDFIYVCARAITADIPNSNWDYFPLSEIRRAYKTFIGRNIFLDHNSSSVQNAVGKVVDAQLKYDASDDTFYVECLFKISKRVHGDIVSNIEAGVIDSVSMGCSCSECECSMCGASASEPEKFCEHLANLGRSIDPKTGSKVYSINKGIIFTELSLVSVPADVKAKFYAVFANKNSEINKNAKSEDLMYIAKALLSSFHKLPEYRKIEILNGISGRNDKTIPSPDTIFSLMLSSVVSNNDYSSLDILGRLISGGKNIIDPNNVIEENQTDGFYDKIKEDSPKIKEIEDKYWGDLSNPEISKERKEQIVNRLKEFAYSSLGITKEAEPTVWHFDPLILFSLHVSFEDNENSEGKLEEYKKFRYEEPGFFSSVVESDSLGTIEGKKTFRIVFQIEPNGYAKMISKTMLRDFSARTAKAFKDEFNVEED